MSYLATGDITPSEARVQAVTQLILARRAQKMSDADIRRYLAMSAPLSLAHPCAGGSGQNLCADWEISQAFGNASLLAAGKPLEPAAGEKAGSDGGGFTGLLSLRNLAIAGAVVGALWLFSKGAKQ